MMSVRLLAIERDPGDADPAGDFVVRVLIEVNLQRSWQQITVRPKVVAGFDASLLTASEELQALFQEQQATLYRLYKLVGEELRGSPVRVPQAIAA